MHITILTTHIYRNYIVIRVINANNIINLQQNTHTHTHTQTHTHRERERERERERDLAIVTKMTILRQYFG